MVVFDNGNVGLLVLVFKLVVAVVRFLFFLLLILILILIVALLLLLLYLGLLLQLADPLPLPDLVVADYPLPHLVIVRVHKFPQDFLLFLVLLLELLVEDLYLPDFCGQLQEGGLEVGLVCAVGPQLAHQLLVVGLHVPENDELLRVGQNLHFDKVEVALELVLDAFQGGQLLIELFDLVEKFLLHLLLFCLQLYPPYFLQLVLKG